MTSEQMNAQQLLLLGEIKGLVQGLKDGQDVANDRLDRIETQQGKIDERLRVVEQRAAVVGAVSGGAMALGTALIAEGLKYWLGRGGH